MRARVLFLGLSLCAVVGCAATSTPKAREPTPAERTSLSGILEPLLTAAKRAQRPWTIRTRVLG